MAIARFFVWKQCVEEEKKKGHQKDKPFRVKVVKITTF